MSQRHSSDLDQVSEERSLYKGGESMFKRTHLVLMFTLLSVLVIGMAACGTGAAEEEAPPPPPPVEEEAMINRKFF